MKTTDPIKKKSDLKRIKKYYIERNENRNYLLLSFGFNTGLRISDILRLKTEDVYDFNTKKIKKYIEIIEKKTKKTAKIKINKALKEALTNYFQTCGKEQGRYLFKSSRGDKAISRIQAYRIIKKASDSCQIDGRIGCHSLRKTFGYMAWKSGAEPALLMSLFNHSNYNITKRYLCIQQEEKDSIYININI